MKLSKALRLLKFYENKIEDLTEKIVGAAADGEYEGVHELIKELTSLNEKVLNLNIQIDEAKLEINRTKISLEINRDLINLWGRIEYNYNRYHEKNDIVMIGKLKNDQFKEISNNIKQLDKKCFIFNEEIETFYESVEIPYEEED